MITLSGAPKETRTVRGKIIKKMSKTRFTVRDTKNRQFNAESSGDYKVGDQVTVRDKVIISKIKLNKNIPHYQV